MKKRNERDGVWYVVAVAGFILGTLLGLAWGAPLGLVITLPIYADHAPNRF